MVFIIFIFSLCWFLLHKNVLNANNQIVLRLKVSKILIIWSNKLCKSQPRRIQLSKITILIFNNNILNKKGYTNKIYLNIFVPCYLAQKRRKKTVYVESQLIIRLNSAWRTLWFFWPSWDMRVLERFFTYQEINKIEHYVCAASVVVVDAAPVWVVVAVYNSYCLKLQILLQTRQNYVGLHSPLGQSADFF